MHNYMKELIKLLFYRIKRILTVIRDRMLPENRFLVKDYRSPFKMYEKEQLEKSYNHFKKFFKNAVFLDSLGVRKYSIKRASKNDPNQEYYYLEFGVWKGKSSNFFSKFVNKLYCFDSFEGLKEDLVGTSLPKGYFNLKKKIPKLNSNVEPIVGWVEDTLDIFLKNHNPKINFVHIDMDPYSSTKFTLEKLKPYLVKNAIIIFDELYNYIGWENGEYKALKEVFKEEGFEYKAFNLQGSQCVIQIK